MKKRNIIFLASMILAHHCYTMDRKPEGINQSGYFVNPLSNTEKQLISAVLQQRGKDRVLFDIRKKGNDNRPLLMIEGTFWIDEMVWCPLTKQIFTEICKIEQRSWYCTNVQMSHGSDGSKIVKTPINYLGDSTRYTWNSWPLKATKTKTKRCESSVTVKACFTKEIKHLLIEFIKSCDVEC